MGNKQENQERNKKIVTMVVVAMYITAQKKRKEANPTGNKFVNIRGMKCIYTNADQIRNKIDELRMRVLNYNPHIIGITETKPKRANFNVSEAELLIPGYKLYTNSLVTGDGDRGCALYVKSDIDAQQVIFKDSGLTDSVWIEIGLVGNDKVLVGCIYRSPNASSVYNANVNKFISMVSELNYSHILIVGDLNHPGINWDTWSTKSQNENDINNLFLNAVKDSFLSQHVTQPTRIRGEQEPSLIDLILTNEPGMVDNVEIQSPLGSSDHGLLTFYFHCYTIR